MIGMIMANLGHWPYLLSNYSLAVTMEIWWQWPCKSDGCFNGNMMSVAMQIWWLWQWKYDGCFNGSEFEIRTCKLTRLFKAARYNWKTKVKKIRLFCWQSFTFECDGEVINCEDGLVRCRETLAMRTLCFYFWGEPCWGVLKHAREVHFWWPTRLEAHPLESNTILVSRGFFILFVSQHFL